MSSSKAFPSSLSAGCVHRKRIDLAGDMPSGMAQAADVPFDMADPMFKFGFALSYSRNGAR
jgi:hypothetical protein